MRQRPLPQARLEPVALRFSFDKERRMVVVLRVLPLGRAYDR